MTFLVANNLTSTHLTVPGVSDASVRFNYDATETRGKRRSPRIHTVSEDRILDASKRQKLTANARDLARNFAIASWMIRRHLDYVASFEFHCRTGNVDFDYQVEQFMQTWTRPYNCDAAGRHSLAMMIRLAEIRRVIDGDCGLVKLANGSLQGIESDRIKDPKGDNLLGDRNEWIHGVRVNKAGRAFQYSVYSRDRGGLVFDRIVPASRMCMLGYFDRFDQVRGVSPLASALNPLRDVYENFDLALAKAKVTQLFALAFYRDATDSMGDVTNETEDDEDGPQKSKYDTDFGKGPRVLDLEPGDRAEFLESRNPSTEFQNFTELVLQVALKALDIPFSFYNESFTNFFGSRAAWLHYQRSCKPKQQDLQDLLNRITVWRLMLAIIDGELTLPAGMTLSDLLFEWVPAGMPWWDPAKEIKGDLMACAAGLDNPQRITKERGRGDFYDNIDRIAEAMAYAKEKGVPLSFVTGPDPIQVEAAQE